MADGEKQAFAKQSNPSGRRVPDAPALKGTGSAGLAGGWQVLSDGGVRGNRNDPPAKGRRVPPPTARR